MRAFLVFLFIAGASARPEPPLLYRQQQLQASPSAAAPVQQFPSNSYGNPLNFQLTSIPSAPGFVPGQNFYSGFQNFPAAFPTFQGFPGFNGQAFSGVQSTALPIAPTIAATIETKVPSSGSDISAAQFQQALQSPVASPAPVDDSALRFQSSGPSGSSASFSLPTPQSPPALPPVPDYPSEPARSQPQRIIQKHIYVHVPQPEPVESQSNFAKDVGIRTNYKIIFIKAPSEPPSIYKSILQQNAQTQEKTIVYVLVKKPEEEDEETLSSYKEKKPSKPEVYFIKYKAKDSDKQGFDQTAAGLEDGLPDGSIRSQANLGADSSSNSDAFINDLAQTTFGASAAAASNAASKNVGGTYGAPPLQPYP